MKSNTKKRLIAFMLCMVLVLSSATSAFADEPQNTDSQSQTEAEAEPAADEAPGLRQATSQLVLLPYKYPPSIHNNYTYYGNIKGG